MAFSHWPPMREVLVGPGRRNSTTPVAPILRDLKRPFMDTRKPGISSDSFNMATQTQKEKRAFTLMLRETIVKFCQTRNLYGGRIAVDGIICISGQNEGQELVIKLHDKLGMDIPLYAEHNGHHGNVEEAEDLSPVGKRRRVEDSGYEDASPGCSEVSAEQEISAAMRLANDYGVKDLSLPASAIVISPDRSRPVSSPSPAQYVGHSPDSPSAAKSQATNFVGRSLFTAVPPFFPQKRTPVKSERWSPNQPIPTIPECKQCSFTFDSFDILSDHNEAVHSVFTCQHCFKTFTSRSNLERHSRLHTGHKPYSCTICGKSFSRKDHLSNHATKHAFKCGTCSKRFSDKKLLVNHYISEHNAVLTNICDFCNKGFSSPESYEEHVKVHPQFFGRDVDSPCPSLASPASSDPTPTASPALPNTPINMKKHACKVCSFNTNDYLTLTKHQLVHTDEQRCFTCLVCAKMFEDPLRYSDHMLVHQNEINVFECVLCRQICSTLHSLRRHEANHVGANERKHESYACNICNEEFLSHAQLSDHMNIHYQQEEDDNEMRDDDNNSNPAQQNTEQHTSENRRGKRKQNFPKPLQVKSSPQNDLEVEEYEVVVPKSPEDHLSTSDKKTDENLNKYDPKNAKTYSSEQENAHIKMEPVRSLLITKANVPGPKAGKDQPEKDEKPAPKTTVQNSSKNSPTAQSSASETGPSKAASVDIPAGPFTCSVCQNVFPNFQELEMHCFSDHNRSPCMFCPKTFAQKANRDRHVCLHTGERPYACPECDEKFSRGDKLKLHRIRAHKVQFPSFGSRQRDLSPAPGGEANSSNDDWGKDNDSWRQKNESFSAWNADGPYESVYQGGELAIQMSNQE